MIIYDDNAYYAYRTIEQRRQDVSAKLGRLLFRLVNHLSHEQGAPLTIVEIGERSAGAYLTAPAKRNKVFSYDALPSKLPKQIDLAYVAAMSAEEMTETVQHLLPALKQHGLIVVDGIHASEEAEHAWQAVQAMRQVTSTLDLYDVGIVLVNKHYLRKDYRLRI